MRPKVREVHLRIDRSATLDAAGQAEPAAELAASALADAELTGYPPLIAAARTRVGRNLEQREPAQAHDVLTTAYFEAVDAAWPEKAAEIAARLWVIGAVRLQRPEADLWGRLAESGLRAAGVPEGDVRWLRLAIDRGSVHWIRGQKQQAIDINEEAIVGLEAALGPDHPDIARALNTIGNALHKLNRPDEAYAVFLRALEIREHAFGPDHPEVANALSNLANAMASMERYEESVEMFDRAIELSKLIVGEKHDLTATTINNSFFPLQGLERYDEAEARLRRALELRTDLHGPLAAYTLYTRTHLADLQRETKDWDGLQRNYEEWLAASRTAGSRPADLANLELGVLEADILAGRLDSVPSRLDRAADEIASAQTPGTLPNLSLPRIRTLLAFAQGDPERARRSAEELVQCSLQHDAYQVTQAQLELAKVLVHIPGRRAHARSLARTARFGFENLHADGRVGRNEVDALLRDFPEE
jgi:tetratricopeptide (TPR) repeat protein